MKILFPHPARPRAFTFIEVLAVVITLALVLASVAPVLSRSKTGGHVFQCLNNHRQLVNASQMYTIENNGRLPLNHMGSGTTTFKGWAWGFLDWTTSSDNTNTLYLTDDNYSSIAKYLARNPRVFKCPADTVVSAVQQARGWKERVRSYALSLGLGQGNDTALIDPIYELIYKISDIRIPTVAETYVFAEEHPDSLFTPAFPNPRQNDWLDVPAGYHNGAAVYSFADGRAEIHKWTGSVATNTSRIVRDPNNFHLLPHSLDDPDAHWVSFRVQRRSTKSY
jgi:prepilin-type processing-associated H-X9-DG protein